MAASSTQPQVPASISSCGLVKPSGDNIDIAWKWNSLKNLKDRKTVTCDFCGHTSTGGITRAKRHQMGLRGDVSSCKKVPTEVKVVLKDALEQKKTAKQSYSEELQSDDDEPVHRISEIRAGKRRAEIDGPSAKKAKPIKGPMDLLILRSSETATTKKQRQTAVNEQWDKEARAICLQYITRFLCRNSIAFNVVRSKSFKEMLEAVGNYGKHLKPPSYHEVRVPGVKNEMEHTKGLLKEHEEERAKYGCSIMSDAWTDRKNRTLINFLVNCPLGSMFVKSVDGSSYMKTGPKVFELLDSFVEEIGESNVIQVVTDNGSNYVMAGKMLMVKYPNLYWTPCAAHCVDLMLEDIGKIARIKRAIQRGVALVGFIYNHTLALNTMRKFTSKSELVRHGVTRFATCFLTLQRLYKQKSNLRKMFISDDWTTTKTSKEAKGKQATKTVLMPSFWNDVVFSLKAMGPLVHVLRLVDNEKKPAMGYIYEAMDRAKEAIQRAFGGDEDKYKEIFAIIDTRWECQLHHPLHAAGHYLNPELFFSNPRIDSDPEVLDGLYKCIERLCRTNEEQDKTLDELSIYKRAGGMFGLDSVKRQRKTKAPAEWWKSYGAHCPYLQKIAVKVLSLTCSSSGCERNWSTFEHIHSKKRNKLDHQKLQDLVYIKYNQALKERYDARDVLDPILLDGIDESNEWLVGEMRADSEDGEDELVFEDDTLTWGTVASVAGASEPLTYTRRQTRLKEQATSSRPSSSRRKGKAKEIVEVEEEESDEETEEAEEEIYKYSSDEDDDEATLEDLEDD